MANENEKMIWNEILKLQLDGVMMHTAMFEKYLLNNLKGYACLHKYHAKEEYCSYLSTLCIFIESFEEVPEIPQIIAPVVQLEGSTVEEKMIKGIETYKNWEMNVFNKLKDYQKESLENSDCLKKLIRGVQEELKCINLMENDLLSEKYEELDKWLIKKMGD